MLKKVWLMIGAVVLLVGTIDLFAEERAKGLGPEKQQLRQRKKAAQELLKYEKEIRAEKKGFKKDRLRRFEGWRKRGPWRDGYGRDGWRGGWQRCKFGQGFGRRGGGRGFGGRGMDGRCPWGRRGGRGMKCPRGWGGRGFGPRMGMRGRGPGFDHPGIQRRKGPGFGHPDMGRGGGRGFGHVGMHGYGMQKGRGARGMRRPWMRGRVGGLGYGRRGPAKRQRRNPAESDFDWGW